MGLPKGGGKRPGDPSKGETRSLVQVLQDIQALYGWLPPDRVETAARDLGMPLAQLYGVATFYKSFSLRPRGRHTCTVCLGTACHVRGGEAVLEHFQRRLGVRAGGTSADGSFTLERVNCLGACALAPLAVIDGQYYSQMTEAKADEALIQIGRDEARAGLPDEEDS